MKQRDLFSKDASNSGWFSRAIKRLDTSEKKGGWPDNFGKKLGKTLKKHNDIKVLSLFSGGGGLDIGFLDAGFNIVECVEIESRFVETLKENIETEKTKIRCIDIRVYKPQLKEIDFIIGGPPCQTFSAAGARAAGVKGLSDQRGTLFEEYVRLLKQLKPKGFLFENVYRIVGAQGGKPWQLIQEAFQGAGYKLHWRIIDAADYGVPQHRERLIIVGLKEGEFLFPYPSHGPDSYDKRPYYNAGEAIGDIEVTDIKEGINGRHGYLLNDIPPGLNYSFYTEKLGHPEPVFGWRSKFSDYLYKADPHTPVRTIKAQGGQYTGPFCWKNRPFSVSELKRLQTFPDDYHILGNRQVSIMQLGNSVPPQLGRILALSVLNQVFNTELPFNIEYMNPDVTLGFRKRKSGLTKIYAQKAKSAIQKQLKQGRFIRKKTPPKQHQEVKVLHNRIELSDINAKKGDLFRFSYSMDQKEWKISVSDNEYEKDIRFSISIKLTEKLRATLNTEQITLSSSSKSTSSLTAIWKYLEKLVKDTFYKDDLIQLFGYYQYRQTCLFDFSFNEKSRYTDSHWNMIKKITNGVSVGEALHISHLSDIYEMSTKDFLKSSKKIKKLGFEIRNHNTNSQLETDYYLIPYQFPTLNKRSLQRLTNL